MGIRGYFNDSLEHPIKRRSKNGEEALHCRANNKGFKTS
jgi:hypothetical protein